MSCVCTVPVADDDGAGICATAYTLPIRECSLTTVLVSGWCADERGQLYHHTRRYHADNETVVARLRAGDHTHFDDV